MTETMRFRVARGPERRKPNRSAALRLFPDAFDATQLFARPGVEPPEGGDYPGQAVVQAATDWAHDASCFADPQRSGTPHEPWKPGVPQPFARVIDVLRQLDDRLTAQGNAPDVGELARFVAGLAAVVVDDKDFCDDKPTRVIKRLCADERWSAAWNCLARSLCAVLAADAADSEEASRSAGRLQRLVLVAALLEALADEDARPATSAEVAALLRDRVVVVPSPPFPIVDIEPVAPGRRWKVAQRAGFDDLWVVREEWACYQPGEIAHIENVLQGEHRQRVHRRIDETETTETTETETIRVDERDTQTTDRNELSDEASRDTSLAIRVDAQVDTSGQYGPTRVETHVGGGLDWSVQESRRHAVKVATESVERAVHRVEERVRTERVQRSLTRIEEKNRHEIDNSQDPSGNVVGVYRWVDKVKRLQLFRYPNRYLLEFLVPEPGALLRWIQARQATPTTTIPRPPAFTTDGQPLRRDETNLFTMSSFGPGDYGRFAARWRARVDPPPAPTVWVSGAAAVSLDEPSPPPASVPTLASPPMASSTVNLVVPDGYRAVAARVAAAGAPIHADWLDHPEAWQGDPQQDGWDDRDGYHIVRAEVTVGGNTIPMFPPGRGTVEPSTDRPMPQYVEAWLSRASPAAVALAGTPEREVSVGITMAGSYKGTVSVALQCEPTPTLLEQWRLDTYAALLDAYTNWQAQYDNEVRSLQARAGLVIEGSSPARNQEVVREELKRLVIEMLYGYRFQGIAALDRSSATDGPPFVDADRALAMAPEVQFLEQIFEWDKLTYVLYPYYWAPSGEWATLQPIEGADPDYARFLRSGAARVVVAARPGYANAVNHWLWFGRPWGGGPAPAPGQEAYVSIADEIRALNQAPDGGEPQESWEVRLPTTLIWLDPDPSLPKYNTSPRLDQPSDPRARLCRAGEDTSDDAEPGDAGDG
jgi:hypothetical protein